MAIVVLFLAFKRAFNRMDSHIDDDFPDFFIFYPVGVFQAHHLEKNRRDCGTGKGRMRWYILQAQLSDTP